MLVKKNKNVVISGIKQKCPHCEEEFLTKERLDTHIAFKHDRSKLFQCSFCSKMYRSKATLESHVDFVHKVPSIYYVSTFKGEGAKK